MDRQDYDFDNTAKVDKWLLRGLVAIVFVMVGGCIVKEAAAHHVPDSDGIMYDPGCCNSAATHPTGDCAPIDDMYVTEWADGYHISIPRGGHPKLEDRGYSAIVPYGDRSIRNPLDNRYHACLALNGIHLFCFHPKPGMS